MPILIFGGCGVKLLGVDKYAGLRDLLNRSGRQALACSFDELAAVVPGGLPASAYRYRPWWANQVSSGSHVQATAGWMAAGYRVESVDLARRNVTFVRGGT